LYYAGETGLGICQHGAKIQVMRENDILAFSRPLKNLFIRCVWFTDINPMMGIKTILQQNGGPFGR
jgi:hypothetical protein